MKYSSLLSAEFKRSDVNKHGYLWYHCIKAEKSFFIMTNKNINGKIEPQKSFGNFLYGPITWSFFCLLRHLRLVRIRNIRFQKMHIPHHASKQKGQSFKFRVMNNNSIIREASKKFLFQPLIIILKHFLHQT